MTTNTKLLPISPSSAEAPSATYKLQNPDITDVQTNLLNPTEELERLTAKRDSLKQELAELTPDSTQTKQSTWKSRLTKFMELEGAVKFDSKGNTTVNTDIEYEFTKKITRIIDPNKAAYDSTGQWNLADIRRYEGIRSRVVKGVGALAVIGGGIAIAYLASKGMHQGFGGGSAKADTASDILTNKPSTPGAVTDTLSKAVDSTSANVSQQLTATIHQGEGVSQVMQNVLESKGLKGLDPDHMKSFIDGAINKDLLNPKNVSGLVSMDVYGGYGFQGTGHTTFSPAFIDYMNQFRQTLEEAAKAKS